MKELRPYQTEAIRALWQFWKQNPQGAPLIVCPTGAGKSLIISDIIRRVFEKKPHYKIIVVSHRKEIISQNAAEIYELLQIPVGIYSASLGQKQIRNVTCANIQSIYKKDVEANLLICDECHLIPKNSESMYQKFLQNLRGAKIVGLTATPMRLDQGSLIAEGSTFTDICFDISLTELIANGFLSPLISKRSKEQIDFSQVKKSGYDYNQEALESAMMPLSHAHAEEIRSRTDDREHILIFCSGVKHAREVSEALGANADYVTGEMMQMERDRKLNDFRAGKKKYLCNCEILTTGFNYPGIDCVVLLRATQSAALYIQAVGRGSRMSEGKKNCLVLDFGGNVDRHGPIDLIQVKQKKGQKAKIGIMPTKTCDNCGCVCSIRVAVCPACEAEFPAASCKLEEKPTEREIISKPEIMVVDNMTARIHKKEGKPDSLCLKIENKYQEIKEFLCFAHGGYATAMAVRKWHTYGGHRPPPIDAQNGLDRIAELKIPLEIQVLPDGKFLRIVKINSFHTQPIENASDKFFEDFGINI